MQVAALPATLISAADIPQLDRGGVVMSPLATPEQGAQEAILLRGRVAPGLEFPAHSRDRPARGARLPRSRPAAWSAKPSTSSTRATSC